jgi:hypothetical protein
MPRKPKCSPTSSSIAPAPRVEFECDTESGENTEEPVVDGVESILELGVSDRVLIPKMLVSEEEGEAVAQMTSPRPDAWVILNSRRLEADSRR